jgi:NAD(P)-dependent dehydrogenase (short-subunit alcohol dehydrogenase family)
VELDLAGKTVLITGASKGIGLACAHAFASEKCNLHLVARSPSLLEEARNDITSKYPVSVHLHVFDLSSEAGISELTKDVTDIDILINNAGDLPAGTIESVDDAALRRGFDLKVFGYISLSRAYWIRMKARGSGVIINDIGNSGENPRPNYIAGSTGNAALMSFTRALGSFSLDDGVRVVGVNPGPVETERMVRLMKRRALDRHGNEDRWREQYSKYPGGRPASAKEVADLIVFLASPRAGYISGTNVTVDGGIAARSYMSTL